MQLAITFRFRYEDKRQPSHVQKRSSYRKNNLQREGNMAKPYQVKQVRNVIVKYKLGGTVDV
jgi:hypothetical protein